MENKFSYDVVAYPSYVFPQTSPQRLASKAMFFGLEPIDPRQCRYLDLGCGDGSNLLLHAHDHPESTFVGVDLSEPRINEARQFKSELGLTNVEFFHEDVMEFDRSNYGEFDYIVAHGLYSWVPDFVRKKVRHIYATCLSETGIGYISFNAYPGCHVREMLWKMMSFHTSSIADPPTKVSEAVKFIAALRDSTSNPMFREILRVEVDQFLKRRPENIFHDDLAEINQPFYFHEFASDIAEHGLQFLCEIEPLAVSGLAHSDREIAAIKQLSREESQFEQYSDYLTWSRFRNSLICRSGLVIDNDPSPAALNRFQIFSDVKPPDSGTDLRKGVFQQFSVTQGGNISVPDPLSRAILTELGNIHPKSFGLEELLSKAESGLPDAVTENDRQIALRFLLEMVKRGVVKVRLFQCEFADSASKRPVASSFARWQASKGLDSITSLAGFNFEPSDPALMELIILLDGSRDLDTLIREMSAKYEVPDDVRIGFDEELPGIIQGHLSSLAKAAYLTA